jgi:hypothetical protein
MKKLIIICFITSMVSGCGNLVDDLNDNPNSPTTAPYQNILTGAEVANIVLHTGEATRKAGIFCGYYTGIDRNHLSYSTYAVTTSTFNPEWNNVYADVVSNAIVAREVAAEDGINGIAAGITQVIQAMALGTATSLWGSIPFDEAGVPEIVSPSFEGQRAVYVKLQALLDAAIVNLSTGSGRPPSNSDIYFDGNPQSWNQVAYTLKARFYMHTKEYNLAYAAAQLGIASASNSMLGPHGDAAENANLNYQFFAVAVRQSDLIVADFMASLIAPTAQTNPDFANYRGNAKTNETGRYNFLFRVNSLGTQPNIVDGFAAQDASSPMVTYQENLLILAEAGFRSAGFATGLSHLNDFRNYMAAGGYMTNAAPGDLQYDVYDATDFAAGGIENIDGINSDDALLREILEERYVTFFGQMEGFNDLRRTRSESIVKVPVAPNQGSQLPERFLYPSTEVERNLNTPNPVPGFFEPTEVNQ